jgi:carbon storage regulator
MLFITRNVNERIIIGDDIILTVKGIDRNTVSIGIDAPKHITIYRQEIQDKIDANERRKKGE